MTESITQNKYSHDQSFDLAVYIGGRQARLKEMRGRRGRERGRESMRRQREQIK
jgi:hypothetical protein